MDDPAFKDSNENEYKNQQTRNHRPAGVTFPPSADGGACLGSCLRGWHSFFTDSWRFLDDSGRLFAAEFEILNSVFLYYIIIGFKVKHGNLQFSGGYLEWFSAVCCFFSGFYRWFF